MSLVPVKQGLEVALSDLAEEVIEHYQRGQQGYLTAIDSYLAIGRTLMQARSLLPADRDYGAWFSAQSFPFSTEWARQLMQGAELEDEVRAAVASQLATGADPNFEKAVRAARGAISASSNGSTGSTGRRGALAADAQSAAWKFRKSVERLERIFDDDRFSTNKEQVASHVRGHLLYAIEVCQDLNNRLNHNPMEES